MDRRLLASSQAGIIKPNSTTSGLMIQYSVSVGNAGVETMEFGSGVVDAEPPVDGDACCVALGLVSRDGPLQGVGIRVSALAQVRLHALNSISAILSAGSVHD